MAAATGRVASDINKYIDTHVYRDLAAGTYTMYVGCMVCVNSAGYGVKASDTAGLQFDGIMADSADIGVTAADAAGDKRVCVERPFRFRMKIAAAVIADIGKPVYALFDNEVAYGGTSNSIMVGWVDEVLSATLISIRPAYAGIRGDASFDAATLTYTGGNAANSIAIPDNLADALSVKEGSNSYLTFTTTNAGELINVLKTLKFGGATGANIVALVDNLADALSVKEGATAYLTFTTSDGAELINVLKTLKFGGTTGANIVALVDNLADALSVKEGANAYLTFITTDSAEAISFLKAETHSVGGSTAAAGTTTADAGVLPAATAFTYPTTAADGTKGVRIHANDKVTGRTLFIGNGVSNQILKVYGPSGAAINGAAGDAAFSSASGKGVLITCLSGAGNTWLAM